MTSSRRRIAAALVVLFALSAPLAAQPVERHRDFGSLLTTLWSHWTAEISALWSEETLDGRGGCDPNGLTACGPTS
jgi:hypothetical protein